MNSQSIVRYISIALIPISILLTMLQIITPAKSQGNDAIFNRQSNPKIQMVTRSIRVRGRLINGKTIIKIDVPCSEISVAINEQIFTNNNNSKTIKTIAKGVAQGNTNQSGCSYDLTWREAAIARTRGLNGKRYLTVDVYKPDRQNSLGETISPSVIARWEYQENEYLPDDKTLDVMIERSSR